MAITFTLTQLSTTQYPAVGFYSRVKYDTSGEYYDTVDGVLKPLSNASPNISFSEAPAGSGHWSWTLNFSTLPTGFYTIETYEATQNISAAADAHLYIIDGETSTSQAAAQVPITHNTGGVDALRYVAPNGNPIAGATVRVYTNADWVSLSLSTPVGVTVTDSTGRWVDPIFVTSGNTYWVQFELSRSYGPDSVSVAV